jgi:CBS domain-containing protein
MRVADILKSKAKGDTVMMVRPTDSIRVLAQRLEEEGIGAMIVSSDGSALEGIISERDVTYGLAAHGAKLHAMTISALMTKAVITCAPGDGIAEVAKVMTQRRIRHLPVKDGPRLIGVISIGDVLKHRLSEMQLEANVLRDIAVASR